MHICSLCQEASFCIISRNCQLFYLSSGSSNVHTLEMLPHVLQAKEPAAHLADSLVSLVVSSCYCKTFFFTVRHFYYIFIYMVTIGLCLQIVNPYKVGPQGQNWQQFRGHNLLFLNRWWLPPGYEASRWLLPDDNVTSLSGGYGHILRRHFEPLFGEQTIGRTQESRIFLRTSCRKKKGPKAFRRGICPQEKSLVSRKNIYSCQITLQQRLT